MKLKFYFMKDNNSEYPINSVIWELANNKSVLTKFSLCLYMINLENNYFGVT